jgi:hypothetical protein
MRDLGCFGGKIEPHVGVRAWFAAYKERDNALKEICIQTKLESYFTGACEALSEPAGEG